jgi:predicted negative regulator of RcsB-dependent stress response
MNQRLTRKDIKRDEFASAVEHGMEYAGSHVKTIVYAVAGVAVLVALWGAFQYYSGNRNAQANDALAKAIKVFQAPIVGAATAKPTDPNEPSFADEASRKAAARPLLEGVRKTYASTDAADVAGLFLANLAVTEGKLDDARKLWQAFIDEHDDHMLAGQAQLNLINLDRSQGKTDQAVAALKKLVEKGRGALPLDLLLNELGQAQEEQNKPQEAIQSYQRILDEFPRSPYRNEAQQKIQSLDPSRATSPLLGGGAGFPG